MFFAAAHPVSAAQSQSMGFERRKGYIVIRMLLRLFNSATEEADDIAVGYWSVRGTWQKSVIYF